MSLFRPEVQQAQSAQWLGTVRLTRPLSFTAITLAALGIAALLAAFATWGEVNRKSKVSGLLVPQGGLLNITAPVSGVLGDLRMAEGDTVQAAAVLAIINTERQSNLVGAKDAGTGIGASTVGEPSLLAAQQIALRQQSLQAERSLRQLQTTQREQALTDRITTLAAQSRQAQEELALQRSRVALAQKSVERYTQLAKEGFMSDIQLQAKQEELIDATARQQSLERSRLALQQDSQALMGERTALKGQLASDTAQIERSQSTLAQESSENATRKSVVITAPSLAAAITVAHMDGSTASTTGAQATNAKTTPAQATAYKVTALSVRPGQAVQAGQTIATLVPVHMALAASNANGNAASNTAVKQVSNPATSPADKAAEKPVPSAITVEAHLFAPSRTAGFLQPGQTVYLRYAAYPYQKFGLHTGHITAISDTPFAANELPPNLASQLMAQNQGSEALYRINVQLDDQAIRTYGQAILLKPGLTLEADVLQERRKVWEWALEPLLAARANAKVLNSDLKPNRGGDKVE
jgi:membrane fusion protein